MFVISISFTLVLEIGIKCSKNVVKEIYLNFMAVLLNLRLRKSSWNVVKQSYFEYPGAAYKRIKNTCILITNDGKQNISIRYVSNQKNSLFLSQYSTISNNS